MWWIQTIAGLPWDTLVHSRWRKLKSCNYVFLWGFCSDSRIFIKEQCSRCAYHVLSLIHHQNPATLPPLICRALFFYWAVWFSWCIDHRCCLKTCTACCAVSSSVAVHSLCHSLQTYWAIPESRCLWNLIQESCQYGKQSCLCLNFLTAMKSLIRKSNSGWL